MREQAKDQTVSNPVEAVVSEISTNEKAIRQLCRIVFRKAYAIGSFSGGNVRKVEKGFNLMLIDLMDNHASDDVKKLIETLSR
tara:strand:- start:83 stop:331 length:249 start_codon:yes stop_codon:yes gene_type:complete